MDFGIFSEYRDVLGKPKEGVHKYRFMNVALVDYLLTIISAFLIGYLTAIPVEIVTIVLFSSGVILHLLFDVNTNTTKFLKGYV